MYRITTYLLIFLVLFTHSTMAMAVPASPDITTPDITASYTSGSDQQLCTDSSCEHCSHCHAHVMGLVVAATLLYTNFQSFVFVVLKIATLIQIQVPLLRPPKI